MSINAGTYYQHSRWYLHRIADRIGRPRGVMLTAMIALCVYQVLEQTPKLALLAHEHQEVSNILAGMPAANALGVREEKKRAVLLSKEESMAQQFLILTILKEHGLMVENTSYIREDLVKEKLQKTLMDLTMTGSYKDFSEMLLVLQRMGGMQIVGVTFERSKISMTKLSIRLQIALLGSVHG